MAGPGIPALQRLSRACTGQSPNLLNAAEPVLKGLRAQGSVAFGLHTGRLLGGLVADGYASRWTSSESDTPAPARVAPPEIEAARRDLETLPYVGLRGTVDGNRLVPGGFGS